MTLATAASLLYPLLRSASADLSAATAPPLPSGVTFTSPPTAPAGAEAGYLPGKVNVSPTGEATYDLPLDVPAGPAGMQPSVGLHYSSRSGNGPLGMGWTVGGLSSIGRCGQSVAAQGRTTGVKFKNTEDPTGDADRFCLDGQALVAISGVYGASGSEYRTENETFAKVMSRDSDNGGPGWFEVWTKDGRKKEYRPQRAPRLTVSEYSVADSMTPGGNVRFTYPLTKETDRSGNVIEYSYDLSLTSNRGVDLVLDRISYSTMQLNGIERRRYVKFVYGDKRQDKPFVWLSGVRIDMLRQLKAIEMYGPDPSTTRRLWSYELSYDTSRVSKRSVLARVAKCGAAGGCMLNRTFTYSNSEPSFADRIVESSVRPHRNNAGTLPPIQPADYNGDGADDLLYSYEDEDEVPQRFKAEGPHLVPDMEEVDEYIRLSDPGSRNTRGKIERPLSRQFVTAGADYGRFRRLSSSRPVDVDGDGISELYANSFSIASTSPGGQWLYEATRARLVHWDAATNSFKSGGSRAFTLPDRFGHWTDDFADVDGDGRIDLLHADSDGGAYKAYLNRGTTFGDAGLDTGVSMTNAVPMDVDGDGRADVVSGRTNAPESVSERKIFRLRDSGSAQTESFTDGRYPMRGFTSWDGTITYVPEVYPAAFRSHLPDPEVANGDFNGDGLQDAAVIKWVDNASPSLSIRYNTGNGFAPAVKFTELPRWIGANEGLHGDNGLRIADMDGDSRADFVFFHKRTTDGAMPASWAGGSRDYAGATILYTSGRHQDLEGAASTVFGEWGFSQLGDFNGDGRIDFVSFVGDATSAAGGQLRLYENLPGASSTAAGQGVDLLTEVSDVRASDDNTPKWPRERVSYSTEWSNKPSRPAATEVAFPTVNVRRRGMPIVRKLESWTLSNPLNADAVTAHTTEYAYENPTQDLQGRGFLGFGQTTAWDAQRQSETVTWYDNITRRTDVAGQTYRGWYPQAGVPTRRRTVTPVIEGTLKDADLSAPNMRVSETVYVYDAVNAFAGAVHYTRPHNADLGVVGGARSYTTDTLEWQEAGFYDATLSSSANATVPPTHFYGLHPGWSGSAPTAHYRRTITAEMRDAYANVTLSAQQVFGKDESEDGGRVRSVTDYDYRTDRIAAWQLAVPLKTTETRSEDDTMPAGELTASKVTDFEYDDKGRLHREWVEKDNADPDLRSRITTEYGPHGEVVSVRQETDTADTPARETRYEYAPLITGWPNEGIHPTQIWSPHSRVDKRPSTWTLTHPGTGWVYRTVDSNKTVSSSVHDDLGREIERTAPGQTPVTTSYEARMDTFGGINGTVVATLRGTGTRREESRVWSDNAGRTIKTATRNQDGTFAATETRYDLLGRTTQVSRPYLMTAGASPTQWTTTSFDSLDRVTRVTNPDRTETRTEYPNVFKAQTVGPTGHTSYTISDLTGRTITSATVSSTGAETVTTFKYGPHGVREAKDPSNNITTTQYDALGRIRQTEDANTGITISKFNGFGDVREQGQAASRERQVMAFDDLGRITDVADYSGTTLAGHTATEFDTAANGIGKPARATSRDGIVTAFAYDAHGRETGRSITEGTNTYSTATTYDGAGRIATIAYPTVPDRTSERFTVKYTYSDYGQLTEIGDLTPGRAYQPLWRATGRNADGTLATAVTGTAPNAINTVRTYEPDNGRLGHVTDTNSAGTKLTDTGYEYYDDGMVKRRNNLASDRDESYAYDSLGRLKSWTLKPPGTAANRVTGYTYNTAGNLTNITLGGSTFLTNDYANAAHPNAVSSRTAGGMTATYGYDTQGRQTNGDGRVLTYQGMRLTPRRSPRGAS
nr:FG-GAP-like repeat-containing protein [Streptomyces chartreusis]